MISSCLEVSYLILFILDTVCRQALSQWPTSDLKHAALLGWLSIQNIQLQHTDKLLLTRLVSAFNFAVSK
jgi:hypothetical protein